VLVASQFWPGLGLQSALLGGLLALVIFAVLLAIAWRIHPDALGMGDLKLAVLIGLASGFPLVLRALLAGFLAGGIIAIALVALRLKSMKDTMPYGPGLIAGAFYTLFVLPAPGT
jgi:leader peptidase (prepilin peptidase)/N-methyltransferase